MGEKKKQHFVPRFYLKNFSWHGDRKSIGVFVIDGCTYVERASLKNQACDDDFYGDDAVIENAFAFLEEGAAGVLAHVISSRNLPVGGSPDSQLLLTFVVSLALRTRYQADAFNQGIDRMFKTVYAHDARISPHLDDVTIRASNPGAALLGGLEKALIVSMDLGCKLLVNETDRKFVTSDNPVIRHNQFLRDRDPRGTHLGFGCKGLQVLLSIDPTTCLVFFDKAVYRVGDRRSYSIALTDPSNVDEINRFQCINADKVLYFSQEVTESYLRRIVNESKRFRPASGMVVDEYVGPVSKSGRASSLVHLHPLAANRDLRLSFTRVQKKAKGYAAGTQMVHLRNPELVQYLERMTENRRVNGEPMHPG